MFLIACLSIARNGRFTQICCQKLAEDASSITLQAAAELFAEKWAKRTTLASSRSAVITLAIVDIAANQTTHIGNVHINVNGVTITLQASSSSEALAA